VMREHPVKLFLGRKWATAKLRGDDAAAGFPESRMLMIACGLPRSQLVCDCYSRLLRSDEDPMRREFDKVPVSEIKKRDVLRWKAEAWASQRGIISDMAK
jgi:hypothetical protein